MVRKQVNPPSVLVVGSVALDTVETPYGKVEETLGGSANYCGVAASLFVPVRLVAVVGEDFPKKHLRMLTTRNIDTQGITISPGRTFRWKGYYTHDLNTAHTVETQLNVFENFRPRIPVEYQDTQYVFLANIDPDLQYTVLEQLPRAKFTACDTMNFWIERKPASLTRVFRKVNLVFLNEAELRQFAGVPNVFTAAKKVLALGPQAVVVKRGEYGAAIFIKSGTPEPVKFCVPGYFLEQVYDPTGAGDSFAGAFIGYLAKTGNLKPLNLHQSLVYGSTVASFTVEQFSLTRLLTLTSGEINRRYTEFKKLVCFWQ